MFYFLNISCQNFENKKGIQKKICIINILSNYFKLKVFFYKKFNDI